MTQTITISAVKQSIVGQMQIADPVVPATISINLAESLGFSQGSATPTAGAVNAIHLSQRTIPPAGSETINLNAGTITGSETITMLQPGGTSFGLNNGLNILQVELQGEGASSITLHAGATHGFVPDLNGSASIAVVSGASSIGGGGMYQNIRSDSIGWPVSSTVNNLVVTNNDAVEAAVYDLVLGGS